MVYLKDDSMYFEYQSPGNLWGFPLPLFGFVACPHMLLSNSTTRQDSDSQLIMIVRAIIISLRKQEELG